MSRDSDKDDAWRGLVEQLRARQPVLEAAIYTRVRSVSRSAIEDAGLSRTITAAVDYALTCIAEGEDWLEPVPSRAVAQARRAARAGIGLDTIVPCYVAGHGVLGDSIIDVADQAGVLSHGAALRRVRRMEEAVLERLLATVALEHGREHERDQRSSSQTRAELVHGLLTGESVDIEKLKYDFDAWHVCVIATGAKAEKAVRGLARALGRDLLPVSGDGATCAWLGGQRKPSMKDVERALSGPELAGVSLAIGEPGRGMEGWRLTHREAWAAVPVARYGERSFVRYLDVEPEATALQDEAFARSAIETYLVPLDAMRIGGHEARRTLRDLFDAENNVSSAAHRLGVDRSTVHRRRNEIEHRLGCRLHEHQGDIEVALRVEDLLERRDSSQPSGAPS